jgi:hypothetical protein
MNLSLFFHIILVLYLLNAPFIYGLANEGEEGPRKPAAKRKRRGKGGSAGSGSCAHLWRPDNLPGKCFGLKPYNEFEELKEIKNVLSAHECRSLCCVLGSCIHSLSL